MIRYVSRLLLVVVASLMATSCVSLAQDVEPHASLLGWRHKISQHVMDRRHSPGGLFFDRGIFRRFTRDMDHEYDLDVLTSGFSVWEDGIFFSRANGFRNHMVSVSKSRFATRNLVRGAGSIAGGQRAYVDAILQEDLHAKSAFFKFGYEVMVVEGLQLGAFQTVGTYKPDLDFGLTARYQEDQVGYAIARFVFLDIANNLILDKLGVDPALEDTIRIYSSKPRFLDLYYASPSMQGLKVELAAGIQTPSTADVTKQSDADLSFTVRDANSFAGILASRQHGMLSAGLQLLLTSSSHRRTSVLPEAEESNYRTKQVSFVQKAFARISLIDYLCSASISRERYEDIQEGSSFDASSIGQEMNYKETRWLVSLGVERAPVKRGLILGAKWYSSHRSFEDAEVLNGYVRFFQNEYNGRITYYIGYRFRPGVYFRGGAAYDADGDTFFTDRGATRFDGGYFRVGVNW